MQELLLTPFVHMVMAQLFLQLLSSLMQWAMLLFMLGENPSVSLKDVEDLRTTGKIAMFYGAPIVEIPNSFC